MSYFDRVIGHIIKRHCGQHTPRNVSVFFNHINVYQTVISTWNHFDLTVQHKYTPSRVWLLRRFDFPLGLDPTKKKCFWLCLLKDAKENKLITAYPIVSPASIK